VNGPRLAIDDITGLIDAGKKNGYLIHNEVDGVSRTRGQRRNPLSRSLLDIPDRTRQRPASKHRTLFKTTRTDSSDPRCFPTIAEMV